MCIFNDFRRIRLALFWCLADILQREHKINDCLNYHDLMYWHWFLNLNAYCLMKGYFVAKNVRYKIKKCNMGPQTRNTGEQQQKHRWTRKKNIVNRREYIVKINNIATRKVLLRCTRLFYKHFKAALLALFRQFF